MKVMGFDELVLVAPRWPNVLRREECVQRASGAVDVLASARVVTTLDEALDGVDTLCATVMTARDFGPPTFEPRDYLPTLVRPQAPVPSVAFLFGSERFGLSNDEVYRCHAALSIPTNPAFGSLNLAAALQLIAYEWRLALGGFPAVDGQKLPAHMSEHDGAATDGPPLADAQSVAGMLDHWEQALVEIGFLDPAAPKKLMPRLNQLFNRARLTPEEIHILRGVAKSMAQAARKPKL
jgi:tRNA/rRNA methyltransferase